MIEAKLKLWRTLSIATLATTGAFSLAGCEGEAGEQGAAQHGEAGEAAAPAASGEAGEAALGEAGGEHGEAGTAGAYAGVEGSARTALRIQHLRGFLLVARETPDSAEAGALVSQGLLEVYEPARAQFGTLDAALVRAAGLEALDGADRARATQRIDAALAALDRAQGPVGAGAADLTARMLDIATGLYASVNGPDGIDAVEYQHSFGAALAARDALRRGERALRAANAARYAEALSEVDRFVALWPAPTAPDTPATLAQVSAQAARVRLALSAFL